MWCNLNHLKENPSITQRREKQKPKRGEQMGGNDLGVTIAGELISSQAKGALALVLSHIAHEIKLARGFKKNLKDLEAQLTKLNALLDGAFASNTNDNTLLKHWLNKVKDAAYDADDLLDCYSYKSLEQRLLSVSVASSSNSTSISTASSKAKRWVKTKVVVMKRVGFRIQMGHRVKELQQSIDCIYKIAKQLSIKPLKVADVGGVISSGYDQEIRLAKRLRDQREWVDDMGLVGRDKDRHMVVNMLCDNTNCCRDLTVIGIVGMAGLGKTSLCKLVSKGKEVREWFKKQIIWVVVSEIFDLVNVLKKMAQEASINVSDISESHALVKRLGQKLNSERYLLILDDVWSTLDCGSLRNCLLNIGGSKGTAILVTSRERNVVQMMETDNYGHDGRRTIAKPFVHKLKGLNKDDSWFLFKQRVVNDEALSADPEKKKMARRMLRKCGGVPLAIRALGDLLRNKSINMWKEIEESEIWDKDDKHDILPSLQLSFRYLPGVAVKRCFSYCAIFPEDSIIEKEKLIQMWMAQGFLQPQDEMEVTGEEYFHILLNSSLFLEVDVDMLGKVRTCKMHDLVWYLSRVVSGEECLELPKRGKGNDSSSEVRHVSIATSYDNLKASEFPKLRTISFYHHIDSFTTLTILSEFRCLRVLSFQNLHLDGLPDSISTLIHLRYLDLSGNNFKSVPDVITKLYHLQTLRIARNGNFLDEFPVLPKEVSKLVNLRHICLDERSNLEGVGILENMGNLTALQTVPTINLRKDWGGKASDLGSLNNLGGTLKLKALQRLKSKDKAKCLNLGSKCNLDHLFLEWSPSTQNDNRQDQVFEGLQPASKLSSLEITYFIGVKFPRWLMEMTGVGGSRLGNLVSLTMLRCYHSKGELNMKNLSSLRILSIKYCYELSLLFPSNGFQCCNLLEKLMIDRCPRVNTLPDLSPLIHLHDLQLNGMISQVVGLDKLPDLSKVSVNYVHQDSRLG